ncbi:tetratricopeptide repeat protein [Promicromonospora sukumoe]|uniref:tetratricopeptide repeat protein n=1 Tax=Promicromonospora sukumoe TaxID=88382 RepID=UPI003652E6AE
MSNTGSLNGWHTDPITLLPVLDDEASFRAANDADPTLEVLVALWSGHPDRAAALLKPLVDDDPTSWHLQALAADVIRDRGDAASAIKILESLVERHLYTAHEAGLDQRLGTALFTAGDHPRASAQFRRALDLRLAAEVPTDATLVATSRQALDRALDLVPRPLTHTRSWGWGIAFLQDPVVGETPDVDGEAAVTISPLGLGIGVRHASDYDWSINGNADEQGPAVVTFHLDRPPVFTRPQRAVVVEAELETPSGSLLLDDAEDAILVPAPGVRTRVVISHDDAEWSQPDEVWVDLYPAA